MVNKNVLSCLLKDGKEVNAVMLVGRLFHARATVTREQVEQNGSRSRACTMKDFHGMTKLAIILSDKEQLTIPIC